MSEKVKSVVICALVACLPLAWWMGRRGGLEEGAKASAWHGSMNLIATVLGSLELEEEGEAQKAKRRLVDMLYLSASILEVSQDSALLDDDNRGAGERAAAYVAEYYWKHPETYDLEEERDRALPADPLDAAAIEAMEPILEVADEHNERIKKLFLLHKPSGQPEEVKP